MNYSIDRCHRISRSTLRPFKGRTALGTFHVWGSPITLREPFVFQLCVATGRPTGTSIQKVSSGEQFRPFSTNQTVSMSHRTVTPLTLGNFISTVSRPRIWQGGLILTLVICCWLLTFHTISVSLSRYLRRRSIIKMNRDVTKKYLSAMSSSGPTTAKTPPSRSKSRRDRLAIVKKD